MNLKDAFPRPTWEQVEGALRTVISARPTASWNGAAWKVAAVVAGLLVAYGAGFASGRRRGPESASLVRSGDIAIRPPVLIAGPRS